MSKSKIIRVEGKNIGRVLLSGLAAILILGIYPRLLAMPFQSTPATPGPLWIWRIGRNRYSDLCGSELV